jgi:hypothetical protein
MVSDPYLWAFAACLLASLGSGQALRALASIRDAGLAAARRRQGRVARALALLSLAILSVAGLLVFADKAAALSALSSATPYWFAGFVCLCGLFAGFRPWALGLPLAGLVGLAVLLLSLALEGWLPLRPSAAAQSDGMEIARLLPYEVGADSFRGQLELPERDSVPVAQDLGLASSSVSLRVECLELGGPLRLAAELAAVLSPESRAGAKAGPAAFAPAARFYRVVGLAAPSAGRSSPAPSLDFAKPARIALLDSVLALPASGGLEPGAPPASSSFLFGLASRTRRSSPAAQLLALEPVLFLLSADGGTLSIHS